MAYASVPSSLSTRATLMPPPPASVLCSIARVLRIGLISVDWNARSMVGLNVTVMIGFEAISGCCVMLPAFLPENRRVQCCEAYHLQGLERHATGRRHWRHQRKVCDRRTW